MQTGPSHLSVVPSERSVPACNMMWCRYEGDEKAGNSHSCIPAFAQRHLNWAKHDELTGRCPGPACTALAHPPGQTCGVGIGMRWCRKALTARDSDVNCPCSVCAADQKEQRHMPAAHRPDTHKKHCAPVVRVVPYEVKDAIGGGIRSKLKQPALTGARRLGRLRYPGRALRHAPVVQRCSGAGAGGVNNNESLVPGSIPPHYSSLAVRVFHK